MAAIKINTFAGIAPKVSSRNLADGLAQIADNCLLTSDILESWKNTLQVITNPIVWNALSIYKMADDNTDYWLSWARDVNVVPSLIAGDTAQRIFYTGDGEPRATNLALAIAGGGLMPASWFVLGVAAPLVAPVVAVVGGSGAITSRAYIETFVTPWGEEGAPSPVSVVTSNFANGSWNLSALNVAPINTGGITGATHLLGVVTVTAPTTYLRAGEEVTIAGVVGMTDLNGKRVITEIVNATSFKVALITAQTYTSGGSWTRVAPHNTVGMKRRIYRTLAGVYLFVVELPIATTSYADTILDAALGEVCPSIGWAMPPADLKSLVVHPGGFLVGVSQNELCCSEPWRPHAWPIENQNATKYPAVGVGVFASTIVVCTTGSPEVWNGLSPDSLSPERLESVEPCIAKRSITDVGDGIMYCSPNGYMYVGVAGARLLTDNFFDKRAWQALDPSTFQGAFYNGILFALSGIAKASGHTGIAMSSKGSAPVSLSVPSTASFTDPETGALYLVSDNVLVEWNADTINTITYDWKSKVFTMPRPVNLGCAQIDADYPYLDRIDTDGALRAADLAFNIAALVSGTRGPLDAAMLDEFMLDGSLLRSPPPSYTTRFLNMSIYADGALKYTKAVLNNKTFSLPSGYKSQQYEIRLNGNVPVHAVNVAETPQGLKAV